MSTSTPGIAAFRLSIAASTPRVTPACSRRAVLDDQHEARSGSDDRIADRWWKPSTTSATSPMPAWRPRGRRAASRPDRARAGPGDGDREALVRRVARPPAATTVASRVAAITSSIETWCTGAAGIDEHLGDVARPQSRRWRRRAPSAATTVHFVSVVSSIWLSVFDVRPIFINRLSDERQHDHWRAPRPGRKGARARSFLDQLRAPGRPSSARRGARPRTTRTDLDLSVVRSGTPWSAFSSGTVMSAHLGRRQAGRLGLNLDERRRELGKDVEGRAARGPQPANRQHHRDRCDDHAKTNRGGDQPAHHLPAPNSTPYSSAAPVTTMCAPACGPRVSTASPRVVSRTSTRRRANV